MDIQKRDNKGIGVDDFAAFNRITVVWTEVQMKKAIVACDGWLADNRDKKKLLDFQFKKLVAQPKEAIKEQGGLRQPHERRRQRQENHQDQHVASDGAEMFVTEGPFNRVIVWDENDEGGDDGIEDIEARDTVTNAAGDSAHRSV